MNKLVEIIKYVIIIIILVQTHFGAVFEGQILISNPCGISHKLCNKQTKCWSSIKTCSYVQTLKVLCKHMSKANNATCTSTKLRLNWSAHCSSVQCGKVGTKENYFYCSRFRSSQHPTSGSLKVHNSRNFPILGSHESHQ